VNSKTVNAFTTGGEHMYLYTALFQNCQTEDELVAVMAHEFAHVYGRHVQKGTQRQYGIIAAAAAAGVVGAAVADKDNRIEGATMGAGVGAAGASFLGMGFTRKDEDEADKYGFIFYTRAGWDPKHFGDFFQRMIDMGYDTTPEMMSDHPTLASRVEKAKERAAKLPAQAASWRRPNVATASEFEALKRRSVEVGAKMPNDQSLAKAQQLLSAFPSCVSAKDNAPEQVKARQEISNNLQKQQK
jgi:predicted Zn-dependent protease